MGGQRVKEEKTTEEVQLKGSDQEIGTPAEVAEIIKRTGVHGEIVQAMLRILEGPEKGRIKRRNIKGNLQKGDVIILLNTEREATEIKAK